MTQISVHGLFPLICLTLILLVFTSAAVSAGEQINTLLIGMCTAYSRIIFEDEPLIDYTPVYIRGADWETMKRMVRTYFPRNYEAMQKYDYIYLNSPEYYVLTDEQDRWIYDRIVEGAGGMNDASVFSQIAQIHNAWANSMAQRAFPNDAPAVVAKHGGGESLIEAHTVRINMDFPDPVMTIFEPYDVEDVVGYTGRFVIARQGAGILAYQEGNHPSYSDVPYLVAWDYEEGRTMTCGSMIAYVTWLGRDNPYSPDIVVNMMLYTMRRDLITDVDLFHALKADFRGVRGKLSYLISVMNFVDRLGANVGRVQEGADTVQEYWERASDAYLESDFDAAHELLQEGFEYLNRAEEIAIEEKNRAMLWIFVIEWLATAGTLFVSSFVVWSLMVRRRLYKAVETSRMSKVSESE
jgi:hypothetical protein